MTAPPAPYDMVLADDGIIDLIAVEIAARGTRPVALTRAERQLAAAVILARGGTPDLISKRLHVSGTTALALAARCQRRRRHDPACHGHAERPDHPRTLGRAGAVRPGRPGRLLPGASRAHRGSQADLRHLPGTRPVPGVRAVRRRHLARDHHRHLGRHHPTRALPATPSPEGSRGMTSAHKTGRRQRARAARQALRLVETETISPAWHNAGLSQRTMQVRPRPPSASTARAALLAAGLPPPIAAALRRRLQLLPDKEDQP